MLFCTTFASWGVVPTARAKKLRLSSPTEVTRAVTVGMPLTVSGPFATGTTVGTPARVGAETVPSSTAACGRGWCG